MEYILTTHSILTMVFALLTLRVKCQQSEGGTTSSDNVEQIELCGYIGGTCATSCSRELRHKWQIALCPDGSRPKCCAIEPYTVPSTPDNRSECELNQGVCTAWYTSCHNGIGVILTEEDGGGCGHAWQTCCLPPSPTTTHIPRSDSSLSNSITQNRHETSTTSARSRTISSSERGSGGQALSSSTLEPGGDYLSTSIKNVPNPGMKYFPVLNCRAAVTNKHGDKILAFTRDLSIGQCGQQMRAPRQKRIIGGSISPAGTWPWHVGISSAVGFIHCAGTIIDKKWILTAAHCFKREYFGHCPVPKVIPKGTPRVTNHTFYRVGTGVTPEDTGTYYPIKRVIKHSLYEEHAHVEAVGHSHKYDIALVELNDNITYTDHVQPVCLPSTTTSFESQTCWLTGWGSTQYNSTEDDFRLRHVRGQVLSQSQCQGHWGDLVDDNMLCFGNERRGGCTGDSGGGLFCQNSEGYYTVAGVISWGSQQCNTGATVLSNIAQYHTWIQNHISPTTS